MVNTEGFFLNEIIHRLWKQLSWKTNVKLRL